MTPPKESNGVSTQNQPRDGAEMHPPAAEPGIDLPRGTADTDGQRRAGVQDPGIPTDCLILHADTDKGMDPALNHLSQLIPNPRETDRREGFFAWGEGISLVVEPGNEQDHFAASTLVEACRVRGLAEPTVCESSDASGPARASRVIVGDPMRHWPRLRQCARKGSRFLRGRETKGTRS